MSRVVRIKDLDLGELEESLGVKFRDITLLERALTHMSATKNRSVRFESYQRLEFLGDRVLALSISTMLFNQFPENDEGDLSRRMADLVRRESCTETARQWNLSKFLRLGSGEAKSGGRKNDAIMADLCEAVIGAIYLDQGFEAASACVQRTWYDRMLSPIRPLRDPKTALQEWVQGRGLPSPRYNLVERSGPDHSPNFSVCTEVQGFEQAHAKGGSRRVAEQAAALAFLQREGLWTE